MIESLIESLIIMSSMPIGTLLSKVTSFANTYRKYLRASQPTKIQLGQYSVNINDFSYVPHMDEEAMKHPIVWRGQPRANSVISVYEKNIQIREFQLCGQLKFSYQEKPIHIRGNYKPHRLVATSKENGEYMCIASFTADKQQFWVIGSKNVRIVVRSGFEFDDLKQYDSTDKDTYGLRKDRYSFACFMAEQFFTQYKDKLHIIGHYLNATGFTMNCESCRLTHQHLKKYDIDTLFIFSFTQPISETQPSILAMLPEDSKNVAELFGIPHVQFNSVMINDEKAVDAMLSKISEEKNSEGYVIYIIGQNANRNQAVIWAYKYKAEEYVLWRAAREIMKKYGSNICSCIQELKNLTKRFSSGEQKCQHIDVDVFVDEALLFYAYWCLIVKEDNFFDKWPTHFDNFNKLSKHDKNLLFTGLQDLSNKHKSLLVIMIKAPPGSGKSTLGKSLTKLLSLMGCSTKYIDQDMVGGDPRQYIATIVESIQSRFEIIVLGKSHHNKRTRQDVYRAIPTGTQLIYLDFFHPNGLTAWKKLNINRINARGENHQSLLASTKNLPDIIGGFLNSLEPLTDDECKKGLVIPIDVSQSVGEWITIVTDKFIENKYISAPLTIEQNKLIIADVLAEEKTITPIKKESKKPMYYAANILDNTILLNHPMIISALFKHKISPQAKHHVTLKFYGDKPRDDEKIYAALIGKKFKIKCVGLSSNHKGIALAVILPSNLPCANKHAHITIGTAPKVPAVYSNTLLEIIPFIPFDVTIELDVEVAAVYK